MLISIFYSNLYLYILCPLISIGFSPKRGVSFRHLIKCLSIYLGKLWLGRKLQQKIFFEVLLSWVGLGGRWKLLCCVAGYKLSLKVTTNEIQVCKSRCNTVCYIQVFLYADIDECARGIHGCHHKCGNVPGSYFCSCQRGFRLSDDLKTCVGKSIGQTRILWRYSEILFHFR